MKALFFAALLIVPKLAIPLLCISDNIDGFVDLRNLSSYARPVTIELNQTIRFWCEIQDAVVYIDHPQYPIHTMHQFLLNTSQLQNNTYDSIVMSFTLTNNNMDRYVTTLKLRLYESSIPTENEANDVAYIPNGAIVYCGRNCRNNFFFNEDSPTKYTIPPGNYCVVMLHDHSSYIYLCFHAFFLYQRVTVRYRN